MQLNHFAELNAKEYNLVYRNQLEIFLVILWRNQIGEIKISSI